MFDPHSFGPLQIIAAIASYAAIGYIWYRCDLCCRRIGCCKDEKEKEKKVKAPKPPLHPNPPPDPRPLRRSLAFSDLFEAAQANEPFARTRRRKRRKLMSYKSKFANSDNH